MVKKADGERLPYGRGSVNIREDTDAIPSVARALADSGLFHHPARSKRPGAR